MKTAIDVLILVEHVARELDIACLLRHLGQTRHGLEIEVASLVFDAPATLDSYRPAVVATPYFYSSQDFGIRDFLAEIDDASWVNLAFEQVLSPMNREVKRPRDSVARERVVHLVASEEYGRSLLSSGVPTRNIENIGSIPCSQYLPPYRAYFEQSKASMAARYQLDPERPWVFLPENFGAAFLTPKAISEKVEDGYDRGELEVYRDFAMSLMEETIPWCWEAAQRLDVEFIIRPRPSSPTQQFIETCERLVSGRRPANLHVIKDGGVREWILAADFVVSSYSTSLIEAAVAGKPAWMLMPSSVPDFIEAEFFRHLPWLTTQEQLIDLLANQSDPLGPRDPRGWAQKTLLGFGDTFERTVDILAALRQGRTEAPVITSDAFGPGVPRPAAVARPSAMMRTWERVRGRFAADDSRPHHEVDAFSQEAISRRTRRWAEVLASGSP